MKVGILAGGLGTRLSEETVDKPKPMVEIGGKPIMWHIMMHYYHYGLKDFAIALGYKAEVIKKYMVDYCSLNSNLTVSLQTGEVSMHGGYKPDWTVELIDTGLYTNTGGRIKRLVPYMGNETFMLTWGDGVSNIDLNELLEFHRSHGKIATLTAVRPPARFGHLDLEGDQIVEFSEKPQTREGWINGAFFVLEPEVFDYIDGDDTQWEKEPLERLAKEGQLMAYKHHDYWQCMDTLRDKRRLEGLWSTGNAPWKTWEENEKMRVLLTGHQGYIGTVLTPMLLQQGHEVVGLDTDLYEASTFGTGVPDIPGIKKDVRDVEIGDLEGFDAVLHLAGLSNDPLGNLNPDLTHEINYKASVRLAELSKQAGVERYIFSSSCSNYGAGEDWLDEQSAFNPVTPYGTSKVKVEQEVSQLADDNFSPTFLRNATAYGVSPRLRFDLVLNNLVAWAFTTQLVYLKSDGTPWRPIVHIEDISRAFIAVLNAPREVVHNEAFNVGRNDDNYRIRELAEIVKETVPGCRIEYAPDAGPDKRCYRVNCSKIAETLPEFQPQWNARKGAEELYAAYQKVGLTLDEFEGDRYKRIAHIQKLLREGKLDNNLRWTTQEALASR